MALPAAAQQPVYVPPGTPARIHPLPPVRAQAEEMQLWVEARLERVLPALLAEYDVDMWILSMREYGEDPVFWSMISPTTFAARRRSIYVFTRRDDGSIERLALGGSSQGGLFEIYRSPHPTPTGEEAELWGDEQWRLLHEIVADRDPGNIVLNIDDTWAFADGLGSGEREALQEALGDYVDRVRRVPELATDYIAVRVPEMMPRYRKIMETVHAIIAEAFSNAVITPGVTTNEDVVWWLRQRVNDLGYGTWFQPSVNIQRAADLPGQGPVVIQEGDMLHTDFGVIGLRLKTDTQHNGYVLREGETDVPDGLKRCLAASNRMQDIQRSPSRGPGPDEGGGHHRVTLQPPDRRPRAWSGTPDRALGPSGGGPRARRREDQAVDVVLHRIAGHRAGGGMGREVRELPPGGGRLPG